MDAYEIPLVVCIEGKARGPGMRYVTGMGRRASKSTLDRCRKLFSSLELGGHLNKQELLQNPKISYLSSRIITLFEKVYYLVGALKRSEMKENYCNENDVWDFNLGAERYITLKLCSSKLF